MITQNARNSPSKLIDIHPLPYLQDAPLPIFAFKPDTSIVFINKMFEKVTGYSSTELIGRRIPYPWWKQEALEESEKDFYRTINGNDDTEKETEHIFQTKNRGLINVIAVTVAVMRDGRVVYYSTHWNDITTQKKAEETLKQARKELELRVQERTSKLMSLNTKLSRQIRRRRKVERELIKSREQLRAFSTYLQSIREDERTAIAREIHDELGQSLTALKLQSAWIQMHLPSGHEDLQNKIQMVLRLLILRLIP